MKRHSTPKAGSHTQKSAAKTNSLQRHGQTVTIMFGQKHPGPSVSMLFEEADLQSLKRIDAGNDSR